MATLADSQALSRQRLRAWQILSGLALSGFLLALPGALLPVWTFHIRGDFGTAGNLFFALGLGVVAGGIVAHRLFRRVALARFLSVAWFAGSAALLLLAVAAPPAQSWYQALALFGAGISASMMNAAVLESVTPSAGSTPARMTLIGGIFFGGGSLFAALLLAQSFGDDRGLRLLALCAVASAIAGFYARALPISPRSIDEVSFSRSLADLRSPLAVFFALLLFFQFANEWSIAGWLPILMIDRMGISPPNAVWLLALYWAALMAGRFVAAKLLRRVRHGRMLATSAFCALFGCTALLVAGSRFGVITGLLLTGAGFSAIYPLVAERIASRFSYYHPGYFNGIFTFALTGGILAPFVLGHLAAAESLRVIPLAVMLGSCSVFALVLLIWLGHKVSGS